MDTRCARATYLKRYTSGLSVHLRLSPSHRSPLPLIVESKPGLAPHQEHLPALHFRSFLPVLSIFAPHHVTEFLINAPALVFQRKLCLIASVFIIPAPLFRCRKLGILFRQQQADILRRMSGNKLKLCRQGHKALLIPPNV